MRAQGFEDAREALRYDGGMLNIRRRTLNPKGGLAQAQMQRGRLVYERGDLKPGDLDTCRAVADEAERQVSGVEVLLR
jgi:hypothetical protein